MLYVHRIIATIVTTVSTLAVTAGCSLISFPTQDDQQDERFTEFTEYVPEKLEVMHDSPFFNRFIPNAQVSETSYVIQKRYRSKQDTRLPEPDRPYWVHAVISIEVSTTQALDDASTGPAALLPPVHPDLHQYVPQDCTFTTVPQTRPTRSSTPRTPSSKEAQNASPWTRSPSPQTATS